MTDRDTGRDDQPELADLAGDLETVLRDLRSEIEPDRQRVRRGPLGLPRPPRPRQVLAFADEVAIPATIAVLEANVKLLQALQRAIRLSEGGRRVREGGSTMGDRAAEASRTTLDRLGSTLEDLQTATERGGLPESGPARELIEEARNLRDEIDRRLREAEGTTTLEDFQDAGGGDDTEDTVGDENRDEGGDEDELDELDAGPTEVPVDVEAELDSLKEQYGDDEAEGDETEGEGKSDGDDDDDSDADGHGGSSDDDRPNGPK
jgi:hypothetical protein